ncbi:hypothetical protein GF336_03980, partial [Candidatus Woesearchaeota archaeon]|nr:hypothetical protein [Candidatus Woesearchaeota archaeon]
MTKTKMFAIFAMLLISLSPVIYAEETQDKDVQTDSAVSIQSSEGMTTTSGVTSTDETVEGYKSNLRTPNNVHANDYQTNLFTGSSTYSYPIKVLPGINGLEPSVALFYNHHKTTAVSEIGNGWGLNLNYIARDAKGTPNDTSDDEFMINLGGVSSKLVYVASEDRYHTEHESYLKIEDNGDHWMVTSKDGMKYYFGYIDQVTNSKVVSDEQGYVLKWYLSNVKDIYSNQMRYNYMSEDYVENTLGDDGITYLSSISYGNNSILFDYKEGSIRDYYEDGTKIRKSRILGEIRVKYNDETVRYYVLQYMAQNALRLLSGVTQYDQDGNALPATTFEYNALDKGFNADSNFQIPSEAVFGEGSTNGVRLIDINGDARVDIVKMKNSADMEYWLNNGNGFDGKQVFNNVLSGGFVDSDGKDLGVRFTDINNDLKPDILQLTKGEMSRRKILINNGDGFTESDLVNNMPAEAAVINIVEETWTQETRYCDTCFDGCPSYCGDFKNYDCDDPGENGEDCDWTCIYYDGFIDGYYIGNFPSRSSCYNYGADDCFEQHHGESCSMDCETKKEYHSTIVHKNAGYQFIDVNGDQELDIVKGLSDSKKTWIRKGDNWVEDSNWNLPDEADLITAGNKDGGSRLADINGDGLPDVVKAIDDTKKVWINTGSGWLEKSWGIPSQLSFVANSDPQGLIILDLDGDGLNDAVKGQGSSTYSWINTGQGWSDSQSGWSIPYAKFTDYSTQLADINGDGAVDIINAGKDSSRESHVNKAAKAYLIDKINLPTGGIVNIDYKKIPSLDNTGSDSVSDLGLSGWVVSSITKESGLGLTSTYNYDYSGGLFDPDKKEFIGFNQVIETRPDNTKINHWFHQDEAKKGLEYKTETLRDRENLFSVIENEYSSSYNGDYYVIKLDTIKDNRYDFADNPLVVQTNFEYDSYGNINKTSYLGDVSKNGDERYEYKKYTYQNSIWVMDRPSKIYFMASDDATKLMESSFTYNMGVDVKKQTFWYRRGEDPYIEYDYDSNGNLISEKDSRGYTTTYKYDPSNRFVNKVLNAKNQSIDYAYDLKTGNLLSVKDPNGHGIEYRYDSFGRVVKEILPYDSEVSPTKEYIYEFDGIAPEGVHVKQKEDIGNYLESYSYYDGLGNLIQSKIESETSAFITADYKYDNAGRLKGKSNPYYSSVGYSNPDEKIKYTEYYYDGIDRNTAIVYPDSTDESFTYMQGNVSAFDRNDNKIAYVEDAYGDIVKVREYNQGEVYVTKYDYDALGNLLNITDTKNNKITYSYDTLGRKIKLEDHDLGTWTYEYDTVGNLIKQTDNKGNILEMDYDGLDRVKTKITAEGTITYTYDQGTIGELSSVQTPFVTKNFRYDDRSRTLEEEKIIDGISFLTSYEYDSMDRVISKVLPNQEKLDFDYDSHGNLESIPGLIDNIDYNEVGKPVKKDYMNSLDTDFSYDADNYKLTKIKTGDKQELNYTYDNKNNILKIEDMVDDTVETFSYDNLDRILTAAKTDGEGAEEYNITYSYDSTGNMLTLTSDKYDVVFDYATHAPIGMEINFKDSSGCHFDMDCGIDGYADNYCRADGNIYGHYMDYSCTANVCSLSEGESELIQTCHDGCSDGECFTHIPECSVDSDCDSGYKCINEECIIEECSLASDCGKSSFIGGAWCSDGNVYQDYQTWECFNPECVSSVESKIKYICEDSCSDGECVSIACSSDSDCGTDNYHSSSFCKEDDVYREYREYSCSSPGTSDSRCSYEDKDKLITGCSEDCEQGLCVELEIECYSDSDCGDDDWTGLRYCKDEDSYRKYKDYECVNPGTAESRCETDEYEREKEDCDHGCSNGYCMEEESGDYRCSKDADCGSSGFISDKKCVNNDAFQTYRTWACHNPDTKDAYCRYSDVWQLKEECSSGCSEGSCIVSECSSA